MKPRTFREGITRLPRYFSSEDARGVSAVIQLVVSGPEPGVWRLVIADGALRVEEGPAADPAVTIETGSDVWLRIMRRELNGAEAFVTGQATAEGDPNLLMRLPTFFRFRVQSANRPRRES